VVLGAGSAIGKLVLSVVLCLLPCVPICCLCCAKKGDDTRNFFKGGMLGPCILFCCAYLGVLVWWAVDVALIVENRLQDGNGYALFADL
jgi:hypothetical protein